MKEVFSVITSLLPQDLFWGKVWRQFSQPHSRRRVSQPVRWERVLGVGGQERVYVEEGVDRAIVRDVLCL